MVNIAFVGGAGRMGQALASGFAARDGFRVAALVDPNAPATLYGLHVTSIDDLDPQLVDAVVDFSQPDSVARSAAWCATHHKGLVIGTTGLLATHRDAVVAAAEHTGVLIASNFSIGAVLAERFAAMAAPYFDRIEIIELHHDQKVDAPSGTSLTTAKRIVAARDGAGRRTPADPTERLTVEGARGADAGGGIRIHSVRLPGLVAHQEVLFGGPGEGLTIRHDSYDRSSFVQGVALALDHVTRGPGLIEGIDEFIR